ncbi:hypothetical protein M407DRAFT_241908 [Tulasnella calospora MUT 4182]|uniref:SWIM-type domain-containing protein n=1 Tax=Tulasnella calospora MUT 4182 TaxID=1051891 RepID=A0A0C3LBJ5_9AGAM|nr:hypothetical protein M407DRAFT_241908 [Tulasnella calospora MUT 4182]
MKPISTEEQSVQTKFCSCPAFAYYVLNSEVRVMCKHILAVKLAFRLQKFIERSRTEEIVLAMALAGTALT